VIRAVIRCEICDDEIAGVETKNGSGSVVSPVDDCQEHPQADYVLSVEDCDREST
jgi:hypothetical protein